MEHTLVLGGIPVLAHGIGIDPIMNSYWQCSEIIRILKYRSIEYRKYCARMVHTAPGGLRVPACTVETFTDFSNTEKLLSDLTTIGILSIEIDQVNIGIQAHLVPQMLQRLTVDERSCQCADAIRTYRVLGSLCSTLQLCHSSTHGYR